MMQRTELTAIYDKVTSGNRLSPEEALLLYDKSPLWKLSELALAAKRKKSGDVVFYNRNIHLESTNVCIFNCAFCSYRQAADSPHAWNYSLDDIRTSAARHVGAPITEVHLVGGVHSGHNLDFYLSCIRAIKEILPQVTIKAYTAVELAHIIDKSQLTLEEGLTALKDAGMGAIAGGGAEIFDERIRKNICPEKITAQQWLDVHESAHRIGLSSNATILYGHIEEITHRIDHLARLRSLQDRTGGFNAFIPLKYRNKGNRMSHLGETSVIDDLRTLAISRLFLDNFPHIKAYWPMYGRTTTELALLFGADDIDGTIGNTTKIYAMAGAEDQNPVMTVSDMEAMAHRVGFRAVERDTFYNPVKK